MWCQRISSRCLILTTHFWPIGRQNAKFLVLKYGWFRRSLRCKINSYLYANMWGIDFSSSNKSHFCRAKKSKTRNVGVEKSENFMSRSGKYPFCDFWTVENSTWMRSRKRWFITVRLALGPHFLHPNWPHMRNDLGRIEVDWPDIIFNLLSHSKCNFSEDLKSMLPKIRLYRDRESDVSEGFQEVARNPEIIFYSKCDLVYFEKWMCLRAWLAMKSKLQAAQNSAWAMWCQQFSSRGLTMTTQFWPIDR
jgi:hypothetical protein